MMKYKTYLSLLLTAVSIGLSAQTSVFQITDKNNNNNQVVTTGAQFYHTSKAFGPTINHEFEIKNISANTITVSLRKYEDVMNTVDLGNNDIAQAYFCFGTNCLPSSVFSYTIELGIGESTLLEAKFDEASVAGHSSVRYKINDKTNTSDAVIFTLNYDSNVGINENHVASNILSEAYPNPSNGKVAFQLKAGATILAWQLTNEMGQQIPLQASDLSIDDQGLQLNASFLKSGIYFISLQTEKGSISKKIILNHNE